MEKRATFILSTDQHLIVDALSREQKGDLLSALFLYAKSGMTPELDSVTNMAFLCIKKDIDRMWEKYDRISEKRRAAGKKGGAPKGNTNAVKQNQAKQANGCFVKQNKQNQAKQAKSSKTSHNDNDNDNDNESTNVDIITEATASASASADTASAPLSEDGGKKQGSGIDYQAFMRFFNSTMQGTSIPKMARMTEKRKAQIDARCREYGKDALAKAVRKAAASTFLNGGGSRGWIADIDWLLRPNNFPKVLEGNYDNHGTGNLPHAEAGREERLNGAAALVDKYLNYGS